MSLSRPVKLPLLKLPFLCIKCVIHNSDVFGIICFATISNRTRRIVRNSKYPLKEIDVAPNRFRWISLEKGNEKTWYFMDYIRENDVPLVLRKNSEPFLTSECFDSNRGNHLHSYFTGYTLDALKMGIDFMIDVFGCTIKYLIFGGNELSQLLGLGINTVKTLHISGSEPVNVADLKYVLEAIKVTDEFIFFAPIPEDFYCHPQSFKCRRLCFGGENSADSVTLEVLCQFDVPVMNFWYHRFSVEDIVSYIAHWFYSENRKLEWVRFEFHNPVSRGDFRIDHLNPMPFCGRRRSRFPLGESWTGTDMSSGMDILRQDGLLATLNAFPRSALGGKTSILFYVWHKRFPDTI